MVVDFLANTNNTLMAAYMIYCYIGWDNVDMVEYIETELTIILDNIGVDYSKFV